jgi:two-component system sensor histidine kinase UhpB
MPITPAATMTGADVPTEIDRSPAPAWFYALIAPPIESHVIPIVANGRQIGSVLIVSEPGDEIAEVWGNTVALGFVALALNIAVIGSLYILFGRALRPLTGFDRGLVDLERRNYQVRLTTSKAREFATLTARFNALAEALEIARAENVRLGRRLITAQDDERKRTARELHDEVGPSLFGLKATATSIANVADEKRDGSRAMLTERVNDMLAIIEHLQAINRGLLNRLRPMALGHIPLQALVAQVIRDRAREHPHISFSFSAARLERSYGDSVDLTIYRCIQESVTNAIRHAEPETVIVTLAETPDDDTSIAGTPPQIEFTIRDDGCGITADAPRGFGLQGMHERVRALGGEFVITPRPEGGTSVRVVIPIGEWLPVGTSKMNEQGSAT